MNNLFRWLFTPICFFYSISTLSQKQSITISGIVVDSVTQDPLPYTAIKIKGKGVGVSSTDDGSFSISCTVNDTLAFTRLGYNTFLHIVVDDVKFIRIDLVENARMLKNVTVYDKINIPGLDDWKKDLKPPRRVKFENKTLTDPTPGIIPTFGPGITIPFGGKDKTKKKRDDIAKTSVYRTTVNSPEVKKQLMELFALSEETFYRKIEAFNKENPAVAYLTNREEIINQLIHFFALRDP